MIIDGRGKWERARAARPCSISEEKATRQSPLVWMSKDANGVLWIAMDTRLGGRPIRFRYEPRKQVWPNGLLADFLRPGRWRKPTKRELAKLATYARSHRYGKPSMTLARWMRRERA